MIGHQRRRFIPEEQEAFSETTCVVFRFLLILRGIRKGPTVSLRTSAEIPAAAISETVGGFLMKAGNVKYVLVGVAVLVATGAFRPTKVLHK